MVTDDLEIKSEVMVKSPKFEEGPCSMGAPMDYFALFNNENNGKRKGQPSTGAASEASEAAPGKIFIDDQYIDSAEALDVMDEIENDSKMTLICESICSSGSGKGPQGRELVY